MTDNAGSSRWAYDENDDLTSESRTQNGVTKTPKYTYFANGQRSTLATFNGETVSYKYDSAGRLVSQTDPQDGGRSIGYSYDSESRPVIVTYPSGVSQRTFYDVADRVRLVKIQKSDSVGNVTVLQSFEYDYGLDGTTGKMTGNYQSGFIRKVTELDDSVVSYSYDALGRLQSATRTGTNPYTQSYTYDANDNRRTITTDGAEINATYDAANQLLSQGGTSYSYDRNGNMVSSGGMALAYDEANRWTGGKTPTGTSLAFGYDGQGRRVSRTAGTAHTDYWYDQTGLALETGATNTTYLRGMGQLASISNGGTVHNYASDNLGNITGLVSTSGSLSKTYSYQPYGELNSASGSAYNPYQYTGTYLDADTGLYQMGARYYQAGSIVADGLHG